MASTIELTQSPPYSSRRSSASGSMGFVVAVPEVLFSLYAHDKYR